MPKIAKFAQVLFNLDVEVEIEELKSLRPENVHSILSLFSSLFLWAWGRLQLIFSKNLKHELDAFSD